MKHSTTPLPSPLTVKRLYPLSQKKRDAVDSARRTIREILSGRDSRLLLVVGPCSIHDTTAAYEYATKLQALQEEVKESFFIVMRAYCEKPRSTLGWKGLLYDPKLNGTGDLASGLRETRRFLLSLEVPVAAEFLDPIAAPYISDLISWGAIGARTAASQLHRQLVSGLPIPFGFKNGVDGSPREAIHSLFAASAPQHYFGIDETGRAVAIQSEGNPNTHLVLRGGKSGPNYDAKTVQEILRTLKNAKLPPRIMIDCSHDNSRKQHDKQPAIFESAIQQIVGGNRSIIGLMLESYLYCGRQSLEYASIPLEYGISLTDPCLGWEPTSKLILEAHQALLPHASHAAIF